MAIFGNSRPQFTDSNGDPISGGKLYIGLPNQDPVANPLAITDLTGTPIANPVTLDVNGVPVSAIKLDAEFSQAVFDINNVDVPSYQISRTSGFLLYSELTGLSGQGGDWNILTTYGKNNFVKGSDGNFYISLTDGNLGNDPVSVSTSWSELSWPTIYNPSEVYNTDDTCVASDGDVYQAKTDGVTGQNPVTNLTNWKPPVIPHGTKMLFMQASAPVGWTLDATHNNKALRIVNTSGGTSGGTSSFTSVLNAAVTTTNAGAFSPVITVNDHVLTLDEIPPHDHKTGSVGFATTGAVGGGYIPTAAAGLGVVSPANEGGGLGHDHTATSTSTPDHNHDFNLDIQYVDSIICTRD